MCLEVGFLGMVLMDLSKSDKIKLSCSASIAMDITASISVSRNQEPFAIKAEFRKSSKECLLEYTIDF